MVNKTAELEKILEDLKGRKSKYDEISERASVVIEELQDKLMTALRGSHNLPRTADLSIIAQSFSQLLKLKLDAEDSSTRSLEKQYDLINKFENPVDTEDPNAITADTVDKLIKALEKEKQETAAS